MIPIVEQAKKQLNREAIQSNGKSCTYAELLNESALVATDLLKKKDDLEEERIAFLIQPSFQYVATQWGSGGQEELLYPYAPGIRLRKFSMYWKIRQQNE